MKRSEAVKIIYSLLHGESFASCEYTDTENYASIILSELEKRGMLPPAVAIRQKRRAVDAWGDDIGDYYLTVELKNQWEKEDET